MPGRRTRGSISMTLSSVLILIGAIPLANSELESNAQVMYRELLLETVTFPDEYHILAVRQLLVCNVFLLLLCKDLGISFWLCQGREPSYQTQEALIL